MIEALLKYQFMQNAFIAAFLGSILCGIIGTIIVEKKMVMLGGGIAHASFGGVGLGYLIGVEPIYVAFFFSGVSSLGMASLKRKQGINVDTLVGIFWAVGMALGILFISIMPGYPPDMSSYLFGDILTVSSSYLMVMFAVTLLVIISIVLFYNYFLSYLFDEEFSLVRGIPIKLFENILFILISISIVSLLKVVGMILVIALLTIPTAIAKLISKSFKIHILVSILFSFIFCIGGLLISYYLNIPSGASIILLSGSVYFIYFFIVQIRKKRNYQRK